MVLWVEVAAGSVALHGDPSDRLAGLEVIQSLRIALDPLLLLLHIFYVLSQLTHRLLLLVPRRVPVLREFVQLVHAHPLDDHTFLVEASLVVEVLKRFEVQGTSRWVSAVLEAFLDVLVVELAACRGAITAPILVQRVIPGRAP